MGHDVAQLRVGEPVQGDGGHLLRVVGGDPPDPGDEVVGLVEADLERRAHGAVSVAAAAEALGEHGAALAVAAGGPVDAGLPAEEDGPVVERGRCVRGDAPEVGAEIGELGRIAAARPEHEAADAEVGGVLGGAGESAPERGAAGAVPERAVGGGVAERVEGTGPLVAPGVAARAGERVLLAAGGGVAEEPLAAALGRGERELPARGAVLSLGLLGAAGDVDRELDAGRAAGGGGRGGRRGGEGDGSGAGWVAAEGGLEPDAGDGAELEEEPRGARDAVLGEGDVERCR